MSESIKTLLMSALDSNDTPADTDTMIVANGNTLKKTTIAKMVDFWKSKLGINDINTKLYKQEVLYQSPALMNGSQTASLSQKISEQKSGIVLVFSAYAKSAVANSQKSCFFIPKTAVSLLSGDGFIFALTDPFSTTVMKKYLYISDTTIKGNDLNGQNDNAKWVLQYIIGV